MKSPRFFLLHEGSPPTPSAFVCAIVMALLLMSLELTVCNEWRLESLLSLIVLLNGELEKSCTEEGARCVQVSVSATRSLGKNIAEEGCFQDGYTSALVASAQLGIRCHPVAIHLL